MGKPDSGAVEEKFRSYAVLNKKIHLAHHNRAPNRLLDHDDGADPMLGIDCIARLPLVTVYIPTKDRLELLKRAIKSVKDQTYQNIEIIVVDDGSTDETPQYLTQEMAAGLLKAIFHEKSMGACAARNEAILCAKGEFITGLDDDDYFLSNKRIQYFFEKWNAVDGNIAGLFDSVVVATKTRKIKRNESKSVTLNDLRESNSLGSQIFAPKSHYVDAGLFDPDMPAWQDWDLWLRISQKFGSFININQLSYLVDEEHDADRITTRDESKIRLAMQQLSKKIPELSQREKSSLTISMLAYPQVKPRINEIVTLLKALRLKSVLRATRKTLS